MLCKLAQFCGSGKVVVDEPMAAHFAATMAGIGFFEVAHGDVLEVRCLGRFEIVAQRLMQLRLVVLDRQDVIGPFRDDLFRDGFLTTHRINP